MRTASWVVRNKETKEVIMETFKAEILKVLNTEKYEAIPVLDYLVEVNAKIKAERGTV